MSSAMQEDLMWRCKACGERNFNHYENCVSCGLARPPPRDRAPSDALRWCLAEFSACETAIGSLGAVIYRLAMLRAPRPVATRAPLTAAVLSPPSAPKSSAAPRAAARIGAARKPRR